MSQTPMEAAIDEIIRIYHEYSNHTAGHDGDALDQNEFKKMIEEQLPNWIKAARDPEDISKIFKDLDKDENKNLNFEEIMALIGKVTILTHEKFHEQDGTDHPPSHCH